MALGVIWIVTRGENGTRVTPQVTNKDNPMFATWTTLAPPSGLFRAQFPSSPESTSQEIPVGDSGVTLLQEIHVAKDGDDNAYFVMAFTYPEAFDSAEAEAALRSALDGMVAAVPGNELIESKFASLSGAPALEFKIQNSGQFSYRGWLLIKDKVLYQAFVTYTEGTLSEESYQHFVDSVTL